MSYDLCVWDTARHPTLPTDHNDAAEIMERLSKVNEPSNPVFAEFARALVEHHQTSSQGEPQDTKAFWGSDPVQGVAACTTAVYRIKLPSDEPGMERLAGVVMAAAKLGLMVYDDELGMCFLPDGTIYPESLREGWKADLEELIAGPQEAKPDNRTLLQTIAGELFDALGRGNKRIY
ncbi:MAG: hypothetical protein ABIR70_01930 [Bryobacteraceae bacterium]